LVGVIDTVGVILGVGETVEPGVELGVTVAVGV